MLSPAASLFRVDRGRPAKASGSGARGPRFRPQRNSLANLHQNLSRQLYLVRTVPWTSSVLATTASPVSLKTELDPADPSEFNPLATVGPQLATTSSRWHGCSSRSTTSTSSRKSAVAGMVASRGTSFAVGCSWASAGRWREETHGAHSEVVGLGTRAPGSRRSARVGASALAAAAGGVALL